MVTAILGAHCTTLEPWETTETREESGLAVLCAGLEGGESTAGGNIIYRTVLQEEPWIVLGASSPHTALCRMPELAEVAQAIDLLDAATGCALHPPGHQPRRQHYDSDVDWKAARKQAEDTRRMLTSSVLRAMLPRQLQDNVLTEVALMRAVGAVRASTTSLTHDVVNQLRHLPANTDLSRNAGYTANFLTDAAKTSHGRPACQGRCTARA